MWAVVGRIPRGRVATYGQIAELAGLAGSSAARQAGFALAALQDDTKIPRQRVINARGQISPRGDPDRAEYQRILLEAEGIEFGLAGEVDLARYRWRPKDPK
ncbi:MAG: methyltransferase [Gammaproteobacteria bacterium]|nr:methyltransferase [Gammaproteobacteria bacterium]